MDVRSAGAQVQGEDAANVAAVRGDDGAQFAELSEPYRRELRVRCYRLLGNLDEAEELVQETVVKAWR